ncbi:MAG: hypothetical protein QG573_2609, partial [Acidobacteriota bacterium]|nr:hypothetical protein [Acidobacteriota bacterium]
YGLLQELDEDGQPPLDQWLNDIDSWAVRIPYNPSNTYGISTQKEIWHLGQWREFDSGQLVWDFDTLGNPVPLEPIVSVGQGENGANRFFPGGGGALRQDPTTGQWLHAYWFAGVTYSQTSTSLADNYWTSSATVCMDTVQALVPAGTTSNPDIFEPGLYHGVLGNRTGWWMFSPVNHLGCAAVYIGAGIVPAELCTTAPPALNVVAPSSGADGSPVTITGTGLDCAGSVKFDGVAAQIQSRAAGLLNVIAPAHLPGAVNVVVTTAGGTATKTNGFIYLPKVSIEATDAAAAESPLDTGKFRLTRTGSTASPLTVTITRGGSATNGSDYNSISTAQTIAQGSLTRDITVTPINDTAVEPPESVVLTVATGSGYVPGSPGSATVTIASDDGTTVSIAATDPTASESPTTTGQFLLTRTGSTTSPLTVTLARGGSATNVSDYASISTSQTIPAGQFTKTIDVLPVNDTLVEPAETVVLTVAAAAGYVVGSPSVATVAISSEDSCVPNATTLCLVDGRFKATLTASTPQGQKDGKAITYPGSNKAGWFWLFLPLQLPEEGVKILDNGVGGFSVTYGASTDNATVLSVEDLTTGTVETFEKLASTFCGDSEAQAFSLEIPADGGGADLANPETEFFACAPDGTTACLLGGRFQVRVKVNNVAKPTTGITEQSASFRLSTATEPDVWVNLIDGFPANQRFWVYFGSLTNQAYTVEVTDSSTSALKTYSRNVGEAWCGGGDNTAFPSP